LLIDMSFGAQFKALLNRFLPRTSFERGVGVLAGGTAVAQVIGVIVLPAITRLYTPEDFSVLAVFISILGFVAGVACLRLDIAIPVPEHDDDAANLLGMAILSCTIIAFLAAAAVWCCSDYFASFAGQPGLGLMPFLWMLPLGIFLSGLSSAIQFWATRRRWFNSIASSRIIQTIGSTGVQLLFGLLSILGPFGLLLGVLITNGLGSIGICKLAWREDKKLLLGIKFVDMRRQIHVHNRFIKYSIFEAIANNGAIQIPIMIIAIVGIGPEAGYMLLAMRMLTIPTSLIGGAVSQVYLSQAPEEHRDGKIGSFTLKTIEGLMRVGLGPLLFVGIVSPVAFPLIFGSEWKRAGEMVAWMTPLSILAFISSPVSMALHITNNHHTALNLQIFGFIIRVGGAWLAMLYTKEYIFEVYAFTGVVFYATYVYVILKITKIKYLELLSTIVGKPIVVMSWIVAGGLLSYLILNLSNIINN
jgi:O-antigen/teichoic acid export membrane protein